jgi:hypothetical protein
MTGPIEIPQGGVLFVRVSNGFRVVFPAERWESGDGFSQRETVFQDGDGDAGEAEALRNALYEAFDSYARSKHRAGIVIEIRESWSSESIRDCHVSADNDSAD